VVTEKNFPINEQITANPVHLIMDDGRSAGTVSLDQARFLAAQAGLDLVAISPIATPPVVRILDYNKFRYQQEKTGRQATTKTKNPQLKEIRLGFAIGEHDFANKAKQAKGFLSQGHFVRAFLTLRGRQNVFADKAKELLTKFCQEVGGEMEHQPEQNGKRLQVIIKEKK